MKIKFNVNIIFVFLVYFIYGLHVNLFSQSAHELKLKAQESYDQEKFEDAEKYYKKSLVEKIEKDSEYNLGNTLYNLKRYDEATEAYNKSLVNKLDNKLKSNILHNLGNTYFENKKIQESIDSYKAALNLNPDRDDTRRNLAIAKQKLKEQNQQNKSNKDQKDNNNSNNKKTDNNKVNKEENKNQKNSKSEIEKLLKSVEEEEKEIQKRIIKTSGKSSKRLKDW